MLDNLMEEAKKINGRTCYLEYQAKTSLRPEKDCGFNCPYQDKSECQDFKPLFNCGDLRYSYLNVRFKQ